MAAAGADAADAMRDFLQKELEEYVATTDPNRIDHQLQLTSFGGAGTTALTRHLLEAGVSLPKTPGQWPFKHRRRPPRADEVPDGFRVIYIVGDPRDAVLSIFRRRYQIGHYSWLNEGYPEAEIEARLTDLETFLAAGIEDFGLADHVDGWRNHPPGYPVMFLRYESLGDAWDEIASFVGLPADYPRLDFVPRRSDWQSIDAPMRGQLDALYGELGARIAAFAPVEIL